MQKAPVDPRARGASAGGGQAGSRPEPDAGVAPVLEALGTSEDRFLGFGGEARVYALDAQRVARVHHENADRANLERRANLLAELRLGIERVPFDIPEILEIATIAGRVVGIERRFRESPLMEVLDATRGGERVALVRAYLETAAQIADLAVERPWFGELEREAPLRTRTFVEYLGRKAAASLRLAPGMEGIHARALAEEFSEPEKGELVHLDYFPGNALGVGERITAVIDFGTTAIIGDRRFEPVAAAVYLEHPITPVSTDEDRRVARDWLAAHDLGGWYAPVRRWLAAYWAGAVDDQKLHGWCRSVLL